MALIHVNFFSEVLGMSSQMEVILPQEAQGQIGAGYVKRQEQYPVLYLLHGMTDNHTIWCRHTSIERYAAERGIAVVMPNGHLGWYTDMKYGFSYYTFLTEELPKVCERFFPTIGNTRKRRFIAGNSMGGYGAMKAALTSPELYAGAASLSGGMDAAACASENNGTFYPSLWEDIFGEQEKIKGSRHDLFALAEQLKQSKKLPPKLFMWCGTEDFLYDQNVAMKEHLDDLGYDLLYRETKGDHSWAYWDREIQNVLDWILKIGKEEV